MLIVDLGKQPIVSLHEFESVTEFEDSEKKRRLSISAPGSPNDAVKERRKRVQSLCAQVCS